MWNWICGLLFFLLSPGVLITLPPGGKGLFFSKQTSIIAALVHAVVFVIIQHYVMKRMYIGYDIFEGMQNKVKPKASASG